MQKENIHHIGSRIKEKRKIKQITLKTLSEYTGLSVGFLSNLEHDLTSPTLENLKVICEALNTSISELICDNKSGNIIVRKKDAKTIEFPQYNQTITYIDFGITEEIYEIITIQPGKVQDMQEARHIYDENCTVLSGELMVKLNNKIYKLSEGDSIYIKKNSLHVIFNESEFPCVSYWVYHRTS